MEIKKSKQANLESKKKSIFLFGLLTSLGLFLMAFEWASYDVNYEIPPERLGDLEEVMPLVVDLKIEHPKPKVYKAPVTEEPIVDTFVKDNTKGVSNTIMVRKNKDDNPVLTIDTSQQFAYTAPPEIEEIITISEIMPAYPGGEKSLFADLASSISSNSVGISGKVYVEFVVEKDGSITGVIVRRGIDPLLDEQAINAVKNLKTWSPGIQNDNPVRVRLVLPINYVVR